MKKITAFISVLFILVPISVLAAESSVGIIKLTTGKCSVVRNGASLDAKSGTELYQNDSLRTGEDGSLSIVFKDDTMISLGHNSELAVNEFRFSPAEGKLSFVTRLLKGTSAYVSGIIGKLSPQSVRFETPVANIGIRGTKFAVMLEDDGK